MTESESNDMRKQKYKQVRNRLLLTALGLFIGFMLLGFFDNMVSWGEKSVQFDSYIEYYLETSFKVNLMFSYVVSMIPVCIAGVIYFVFERE